MDLNFAARVIFSLAAIASAATGAPAQNTCVTAERIATLLNGIKGSTGQQANPELRIQILSMKDALAAQNAQAVAARKSGREPDVKVIGKPADEANPPAEKPADRICRILEADPWPGKSVVDAEAASAWIRLIKTYLTGDQQRALLPVIVAGAERGEVPKNADLASFIDRLRLRFAAPQLFGTQVTEQDGFLVLYPLQSEQNIDAWRSEYGMQPLDDYIRAIQNVYDKLVIRSTAKVRRVPVSAQALSSGPGSAPLEAGTDEAVVKVDTSLVIIDATVSGASLPKLGRGDFKVYEDGQEQEITEFHTSDEPFDIVLLLDLSGSTADKVGLIKKTTKRFVEMKRESDRVAIVTFNSGQTVVSPLEADKKKLFDRISDIKGRGSSMVWDSEKFAMDLLERDSAKGRRKAVVVMTDGIDNGLFFSPGAGSKILFGDLLEDVRNSQISLFPIYLNPVGPGSDIEKLKDDGRRTMQLLADASGGTFYTTANLDNLNQVYERVLKDVGTVYSLGYQPKNDKRDGSWREIKVEAPGHPELKVRARAGYYAK